MAGSLNKVILVGRLGKDPEVRTMQDGKQVASLVLATSTAWKNKTTGEKTERTEWHKISIFAPGLVEVIKNYTHKGSQLYIEGALQTNKWIDKDNIERYSTEVVLQGYNCRLILLDRKENSDSIPNMSTHYDTTTTSTTNIQSPQNKGQELELVDLDDDIPF